jgi:glyoxylase-like metal-dependent hydrolase (beta-lactamase superfamily II)
MKPALARGHISTTAAGVCRLSSGVANFYLLEKGGRFTLVDAGTPADWGLFEQAVASRGHTATDLDAVVLTHAHADHTGFAERARAEVGARVWAHQADAGTAKGAKPAKNDGAMARYLWRAEFYRTLISLTRRGGAKIVPVVEVSAFADGEVIDVPGKPRAVHAPGHTPGNAALLLEDARVLLSGDTLVTRNPLTGRTGPQVMPSGFNNDTRAALASLGVLEGLRADTVLPGHGEPWAGSMAEAVRLARDAGAS